MRGHWPGTLCKRCLGLLHCLSQGTLLAGRSHFGVNPTAAYLPTPRERTSPALELARGALSRVLW